MRIAGIDIGAETIKYALLDYAPPTLVSYDMIVHEKQIEPVLRTLLDKFRADGVDRIAVCGRYANHFKLKHYPAQAVQKRGLRQVFGDDPLTYVTIGCNGFSVLERRGNGADVFRENARCSQGTGNFLRQLVERFDLELSESDALCNDAEQACALSGRCPVILKTDMTHLANRGENQASILAGVYDAICENVEALIKPSICPPNVILSGGVTRSERIRRHFEQFCTRNGMKLLQNTPLIQFYIEALGCAYLAAEYGGDAIPDADAALLKPGSAKHFDEIPPLRNYLSQVRRLSPVAHSVIDKETPVFIGFDIGSTGSKAVAIQLNACENALADVCWEGYLRTNGNPVLAARLLMGEFMENMPDQKIVGFGVTGSGREIVGSMLSTCYGQARVYILNEIAAHAEGARAIEPRVDTIFEIGGQDAKYIRLSEGRIVDAAMNEACSAGTGSFIEEQGRKFKDIQSLSQLSELALSGTRGVSLGQHCSVFMTQIIEEAVAAGIETSAILAGIYDSVVLNYFYRVKGNRSVGNVVFCQGMPFCTPALAAAVVRQTQAEVIIPPNPGTIGAFGIARLARKSLTTQEALDPQIFMASELIERKTFVCASNKGCGGNGNHCKIDRIVVRVNDQKLQFTWGGACSLWDHGIASQKLPDMTPNPFQARKECIDKILASLVSRGRKRVAISDEFQLKTLFPFFATFLYELGYDLEVIQGGTLNDLRRGLDESNVRFCAPMQHYHGVASKMRDSSADYLFWPMMRCGKFAKDEPFAAICPVVQSSPDLLMHDLKVSRDRVFSPVIDLGPGNLRSQEFRDACCTFAKSLAMPAKVFETAFEKAAQVQARFEDELISIGRQALDFAEAHHIPAVIVLGRNYTIHNPALNSNVPALLRGQGALAIPVDCYPIDDAEPLYTNIYWSYGQINLRATTQIRNKRGQYAVWCSNYACGPDSFNLHFYQFIMQGKPYAVIETDGHSGDAGTKTRIEAFLHCIREYEQIPETPQPNNLHELELRNTPLKDAIRRKAKILIPKLGEDTYILEAVFRHAGADCYVLPEPTRETLLLGRRYTSGKECLPMLITLGGLLEYVNKAPKDAQFVYFMPRSNGPCRLGCYNLMDKIVLERLGLSDRVSVWSMTDTDYSEGVSKFTYILGYVGFLANDVLLTALYDIRPIEREPGAANRIYERAAREIIQCIDNAPPPKAWQAYAAKEIFGGTFFGMMAILKRAAREFAAIRTDKRIPTVCLTGEIYVRHDPFANSYMIRELEARGIRVKFAHFGEWIEYADIVNKDILKSANTPLDIVISHLIRYVMFAIYRPAAKILNWPDRHEVSHILDTAAPYLRKDLIGEEILTIGTPLHAYRKGEIDGVVSVGPLECMPSKIAESQFYHLAENDGLISLNLSFNGDPIPDSVLDDFCFEVKRRFEMRENGQHRG
ncbi:MAG: CoA activase [Proteobacteria bacterium]|nr:CoA activase [Pseudomonadota bacterium]